jgi:hypothetical protein
MACCGVALKQNVVSMFFRINQCHCDLQDNKKGQSQQSPLLELWL